ncbi:MAG: hypothetical protein AAFZ49_13615 [Cyanobacteria bacterium J06659_2]
MTQFIVYACPTGHLAEQLQAFLAESSVHYAKNAAHSYMPHCTLTGFFDDFNRAVPIYTRTLVRAYKRALRSRPNPALTIKDLSFKPDWHGLELDSPWLKQLVLDFACTASSPSRKNAIRPKSWLHLSLAYEFVADQAESLAQLAQSMVDPNAPADWELRFYQRDPGNRWICHQALPLS